VEVLSSSFGTCVVDFFIDFAFYSGSHFGSSSIGSFGVAASGGSFFVPFDGFVGSFLDSLAVEFIGSFIGGCVMDFVNGLVVVFVEIRRGLCRQFFRAAPS
jgi:hypothetical protein